MAKRKTTDENGNDVVIEDDLVETETGDSDGDEDKGGEVKKVATKRRRRLGGKFVKGKMRRISAKPSFLQRINPGPTNLIKLALVAAGAALLYDYFTKGSLIGLFKPRGTPLPSTGGATTPIVDAQAPLSPNPTNGTSPAGGVNMPPPITPYTSPVSSTGNTPIITTATGSTIDAGGDLSRDITKFAEDSRFRESMLNRGAKGYPYAVALLQKANTAYTWDEWNYYRSRGGGKPIDIDALGLSNSRGVKVVIDTYLSRAGIDPSEAYNYARSTGLGSLSQWLA